MRLLNVFWQYCKPYQFSCNKTQLHGSCSHGVTNVSTNVGWTAVDGIDVAAGVAPGNLMLITNKQHHFFIKIKLSNSIHYHKANSFSSKYTSSILQKNLFLNLSISFDHTYQMYKIPMVLQIQNYDHTKSKNQQCKLRIQVGLSIITSPLHRLCHHHCSNNQ